MSKNISLVQIINDTNSEGVFTNLQTSADNMALGADASTNTPGQHGEGCHIPDCGAGKWWDDHHMTVTLGKTTISLWKEHDRVYYRLDQTVYPGPEQGMLLWSDNGLPVVLTIGRDSTATMANP